MAWVKDLKEVRRGRIQEYAEKFGCEDYEGRRPWHIPCQIALPCATQNEIEIDDATILTQNGVITIGEGANMPSTLAAAHRFLDAGVLFGPAKAANAGRSCATSTRNACNTAARTAVPTTSRAPTWPAS